ncbi:MAG TPA: AsmA family protein [Bryobacteraceae bacterium]|nr:AsmA family protein [Bryobacteraceae bacterium]
MKRKALLTILCLIALIAGVAPFLKAERFRDQILHALEQALHRKVDVQGKLRFSVWPGLGFSIEDVVIHEDPAVGVEPFAYVAALDANISLTALLQGKWEVSAIVLDEPTVNLAKQDSGSWNIRPLLSQTGSAPSGPFPAIEVRNGRLNLKFGDTKSVLYFMNADVAIKPGNGSQLQIRFSMEPERTDRSAQGIGTLSGRAKYTWYPDKPSGMELDLDLERSALSEIVTLLEGSGAGMRGFLASKARIEGPINKLRIAGELRLEDIQRWDLLKGGIANAPLRYRGTLDFPAGELDLETQSDGAATAVRLQLRGHSLLENASWGALARFDEFPVTALRDLLQYMNVSLPGRVGLEGKLSGVLGYSPAHGLQGMVNMPEGSVKSGGTAFQLRGATFAVEGERFRLLPARLDLGGDRTAEIQGSYSPGTHSFSWRTGETTMPVKDLLASHRQLIGTSIPLLEQLTGGNWRGTLQFEKNGGEAAHWNGHFALQDARLELGGLSAPIEIKSASGAVAGNRISLDAITGRAGKIDFQGSYRQELTGPRPHRLRVVTEELDAVELEKLFLPTLKRSGGFLRTLSFRAQLPEWLKERHLEAQIRVKSLWATDIWLGSLSGRLVWDGGVIELAGAEWEREGASGEGKVNLRLAKAEPEYRIQADFMNLPWKGGEIEGEASIEASGTGAALLRNAKSSGKFAGRGLDFPPENDFRSVAGNYEFSIPRGTPLLKLSGIELICGPDTYTGQGGSETDGRVFVDLTSGKKRLRMGGTVWPFQLEMK